MTNRLNLLRGEMRTVEMAHEKASIELEDSLRQLTHSEKLRIERLETANTEYRHLEAYVKSSHILYSPTPVSTKKISLARHTFREQVRIEIANIEGVNLT